MAFTDICNKLCFRRLCLRNDTDIDLLRDGTIRPCVCTGEKLMHVSACFKEGQYVQCIELWSKQI